MSDQELIDLVPQVLNQLNERGLQKSPIAIALYQAIRKTEGKEPSFENLVAVASAVSQALHTLHCIITDAA
jgi:hypothetical protein